MSLNKLTRRTVGEKVAMAGGAAALAMVSGNMATAGIVASTTAPITCPTTTAINWDVDSDGTADFQLAYSTTSSLAFLSERNGGRIVAPNSVGSDGFAKLASGFVVESLMAGFKFFTNAQGGITVTSDQGIGGDLGPQGWSMGDTGFFGFKFTSGGNTYYGWGEIHIQGLSTSPYTITRAYYNSTPFAPITVGDTGSAVPEPSACALALLAAGGVAAYRGRRKQVAA